MWGPTGLHRCVHVIAARPRAREGLDHGASGVARFPLA
jgi:hypothetical protein